jgi:hypothetical protein
VGAGSLHIDKKERFFLMQKKYSIFSREKIVAFVAILLVAVAVGIAIGASVCQGESLATVYAMCKPGSRISVRMKPSRSSPETGFLECGDSFQTDAEEKNGWIRCYGVGENGWVYVGYVSTEPVQKVGQRYVCVAKKQAACRRWAGGPQIEIDGKKQWLRNGENVNVFCIGDEWAVTSKGYVKAEWLEVDPE